ncbi:MAG: aminotransferase class IV, partial [Nitrospirales bacterium]
MWIFLNDRFVHREEARVSVFDRGFLYGDGVYETLRAYGGRVFMLHQHLERLRRSSEGIALPLPWSEQEWVDMIRTLLERNRLRLEASGGDPAGPPV